MGPIRISFLVKSLLTRRPRIMDSPSWAGGQHWPPGESADRFLTSLFPNFSYAYQIKEIKQGIADSKSIRKSPHDPRMKFSSDSRTTHRHVTILIVPGRTQRELCGNTYDEILPLLSS